MAEDSIVTGHPAETAIFTRRYAVTGSGLAVAVKDSLDMAGEVTTSGCRALRDASPAPADAEVVDRLRVAGCRIVGRTNMHELAYGVTGVNAWTGTPTNPRWPTLVPGGSSSGSAVAVAAGLVDFAIGSDTGGSIRVPATCCGVVGLKPTFGRVSRKGAHPAASSLDCVGPFARDVAMIEQAMAIIAPDWRDIEPEFTGRLGWIETPGDPAIAALVRTAGDTLGALEAATLPSFDAAIHAGMVVIGHETWQATGHLIETGQVGLDVHQRLLRSAQVTAQELATSEEVRARFSAEVDAALAGCDALLLPALGYPVPSLLEAADASAALPITNTCRPFNLSGHPAIALPAGELDGRPVSIQLVGRKGEDEALCALARRFTLYRKGEA